MNLFRDIAIGAASGLATHKVTEKYDQLEEGITGEHKHGTGDLAAILEHHTHLLQLIADALSKNSDTYDIDTPITIPAYPSALSIPHFRPARQHNMLWFSTPGVTLIVDMPSTGHQTIPNLSMGWNTLDLPEGVRISVPQNSSPVPSLYRVSNTPATALPSSTTDTTPSGQIAGTGAANTTGGADYTYTFSQQVNHWEVQNNTSANVNINTDAAASPGTFLLIPGATYREDEPITVMHLYTVANQNVNGSIANNIVIRGWL